MAMHAGVGWPPGVMVCRTKYMGGAASVKLRCSGYFDSKGSFREWGLCMQNNNGLVVTGYPTPFILSFRFVPFGLLASVGLVSIGGLTGVSPPSSDIKAANIAVRG